MEEPLGAQDVSEESTLDDSDISLQSHEKPQAIPAEQPPSWALALTQSHAK